MVSVRWNIQCGVVAIFVCAVAWAARAQVPSVGHGRTVETVVTGAVAEADVVVAGTLRKLGEGRLTVTASHFTGGTIEVDQGTLALDASSSLAVPVLPPHILTNNLLLWVDATTNVVMDSEAPTQVQRWCDVRETDTAVPTLMYAGRYGESPGPALASHDWLGAKQHLDFGTMKSSGCWLALMQPGTGGTVTSNKALVGKSFFAVRGTRGGNGYHGFFFGGWNGSGNGGSKDFHVGSANASPTPLFADEAVDSLRNAWVSLDGRRVGYTRHPHDWYELFGAHLVVGTAQFSNFFNDRNYMPPVTNFRQGGGQLAEVLVFDNVLSENDRLTVEAYLQSKWFNRACQGGVAVRTGATAEMEIEQGETLTLSGLDGDGLLVKRGSGTLHLRRQAGLPLRAPYVEKGALTLGPLVKRNDFDVTITTNSAADFATGGRRVTVTDGSIGVQTLTEAGVLAKAGAGVWSTAEIPQGVKTVRVEAGTLRLAPPIVSARAPLVIGNAPNADFEKTSGSMGAGAWGYGSSNAEWTFMPQTRITEIGATNQVDKGAGLATPGSPWLAAWVPLLWGGRVVAFVQRSGTMEGTVTLPQAGVYRLTFAHARRTSHVLPHLLEVVFDGVAVGKVEANSDLFTRRDIRLPYREAGSYSLMFRGVHIEAGDRTSLIDDIRLERVEEDGNLVQDGSFEETGDLTLRLNSQTRYEIGSVLNGRGWTFSDAVTNLLSGGVTGTNIAAAGVAEDLGGWMVSPVAGGRAAFLFSNGKLHTTVTFPSGGVYRVSFLGAGGAGGSPFTRAAAYTSVNARHTLDVTFDGTKIAPISLGPPGFQPFEVTLPAVTQGQTAVIGFEGSSGTNGHMRIGLIDDVRVTYVGPSVVQEGGFENPVTWGSTVAPGGAAWSFTSTADSGDPDTKSGICVERQPFAFAVPMGRQVGWIQRGASIRQSVTFPEDGYYAVSFMAAARTEGNYSHTGHDLALMLNDVTVGTVTTTDYLYERYTFRLPYVKAGVSYQLVFQGLNSAGGDRSSAIDDVRVTRLAVAEEYVPFPEGLTIELAEGAKLTLDFAGTQPLHALRINGRHVSGTVSATTHPAAITGTGTLQLPNLGSLLFLR